MYFFSPLLPLATLVRNWMELQTKKWPVAPLQANNFIIYFLLHFELYFAFSDLFSEPSDQISKEQDAKPEETHQKAMAGSRKLSHSFFLYYL